LAVRSLPYEIPTRFGFYQSQQRPDKRTHACYDSSPEKDIYLLSEVFVLFQKLQLHFYNLLRVNTAKTPERKPHLQYLIFRSAFVFYLPAAGQTPTGPVPTEKALKQFLPKAAV